MNASLIAIARLAATHWISADVLFIGLRSTSVIYPPIPGFPIDLLGMELFGVAKGFVLAEGGIMLGASIAFLVGRFVRDALPVSKARQFREFEVRLRAAAWLSEDAAWWEEFREWGVLRLLTNPLFDPISYVAGLSQTRFGPYFLGSLIGNIPSMVCFYILEEQAMAFGPAVGAVAAAGFIVCAWYLVRRCFSSYQGDEPHGSKRASRPTAPRALEDEGPS